MLNNVNHRLLTTVRVVLSLELYVCNSTNYYTTLVLFLAYGYIHVLLRTEPVTRKDHKFLEYFVSIITIINILLINQ